MIRAVIFDMYETLITHYDCPLYFSKEMAEDCAIDIDAFREMWNGSDHERTIGPLTFEEIITLILKKHHKYSDELLKKISDKRVATKEECFRHLHKDIIPLLDELKRRGLKIGLISNCFSEEAPVIRNSVLAPYFDSLCLSYELGMKKPEPGIYEYCVKELGVAFDECLYIGDGGSDELAAARSLGMKAVQCLWYTAFTSFDKSITEPLQVIDEL